MICVKDAGMNVVHLSPEWEGFTGLDLASSVGRGWLAAVHAEDRSLVDDVLRGSARERRGYDMTYRLLHRAGIAVWVSDGAVASFAPEGHGFLGLIGSITEIVDEGPARAARGRVGEFRPPPPMASTLTAAARDLIADHLLLARALTEQEGDRVLLEALDFTLYLARKRLDRSTH